MKELKEYFDLKKLNDAIYEARENFKNNPSTYLDEVDSVLFTQIEMISPGSEGRGQAQEICEMFDITVQMIDPDSEIKSLAEYLNLENTANIDKAWNFFETDFFLKFEKELNNNSILELEEDESLSLEHSEDGGDFGIQLIKKYNEE